MFLHIWTLNNRKSFDILQNVKSCRSCYDNENYFITWQQNSEKTVLVFLFFFCSCFLGGQRIFSREVLPWGARSDPEWEGLTKWVLCRWLQTNYAEFRYECEFNFLPNEVEALSGIILRSVPPVWWPRGSIMGGPLREDYYGGRILSEAVEEWSEMEKILHIHDIYLWLRYILSFSIGILLGRCSFGGQCLPWYGRFFLLYFSAGLASGNGWICFSSVL